MDDETFNLQLRQFLKRFGITAQREIERAVAEGIERGSLKGTGHCLSRRHSKSPAYCR